MKIFLGLLSISLTVFTFAADYEIGGLENSVVEINLETRTGTRISSGVAISPTLVLTTSKATGSLLGGSILVNELNATVARTFKPEGLAIVSKAGGAFSPATFAYELPEEGRNLKIVQPLDGTLNDVTASLIAPISAETKKSGFFDLSSSPELISRDGAPVFNNCGELVGLFDKNESRKLSVARNLDQVKSIALSSTKIQEAAIRCPSESEKELERVRLAKKAQQASELAKEEEFSKLKEESKERDRKAQEQLDRANADLEEKRAELEAARAAAEEALETAKDDALEIQKKQKRHWQMLSYKLNQPWPSLIRQSRTRTGSEC